MENQARRDQLGNKQLEFEAGDVQRKQTISQVLMREGERWFQSNLPSQWVYQRPSEDYGIDGIVVIGDDSNVSPHEFGVQIKTSANWCVKDDHLNIPIPLDTVRYWIARILPTLLVLYDAQTKVGYYAWVPELVSSSDLADRSRVTLSLRIPIQSQFEANSWTAIKDRTLEYHRELAGAFTASQLLYPVLQTVRSLAEALRLLVVVAFTVPRSEEDKMALGLAEVVAHREVVTSIERLASKVRNSSDIQARLNAAATAYRSLCSTFLHPFDDFFINSSESVAIWANDAKAKEMRPQLMSLITSHVIGLTAIAGAKTSP